MAVFGRWNGLLSSIVGKTETSDILDLTAVAELRGISEDTAYWRIGATTSWSEIRDYNFPPFFDGLRLAAKEVGGMQIQASGTIGGNICNASPAADGVTALLALDAEVEILGPQGIRVLPIDQFVIGNRRTALKEAEIVYGIRIPKPAGDSAFGYFKKLGSRRYLVISLVMVSAVLCLTKDRKITDVRITVGACSEVACRLFQLEKALAGASIDENLEDAVKAEHLAILSPIDDVRASAEYRLQAAQSMLRDMLSEWGQYE